MAAAMNRARRTLASLRLPSSLFSDRTFTDHSTHTQVTHFFHPSPSYFSRFRTSTNIILNANQKLFFSTMHDSVIELVLSNDWSAKFEKTLSERCGSPLSHEAVMYLLKRLTKDPRKAQKFFDWAVNANGFEPNSSVYSLMLRIYAHKDSMKEFWVIVREMREKGVYFDGETYKSIFSSFRKLKMDTDAAALEKFHKLMMKENDISDSVNEVVAVIKRSDWGFDLEKELLSKKILISDNFILRVLKELRDGRCPLKAVKFFKWVGERLGYDHNGVTYNGILRVLPQEESVEEFWSMLKEMKTAGYDMDLDTYIKVSRTFQKNKRFKDAVELYEYMMDSPYKPSTGECAILLRSIAARVPSDLDLIFRVVKKYEEAGNSLSKPIYDVIHRSMTCLGRFDEAEKIMEAMRNAGYEADNITYSQLIYGLCKARRLEEACEVIDVMEGQGCDPDIKTWTILIQGHCEANAVDKALLCLAKMMEKNVDVDGDLLDVLINGFVSQRKVVGAYELLKEMVNQAHLRPWQATYKNLIEKLLGEMRLDEALDLLGMMKKHNYPPFAEPFYQYISKLGTVEDAKEFLKALSKGYPSVAAYQHVLESFFEEGRHSEAKDLLYKCPHHIRKHPKICSLFGSTKSTS
nr:pentatricopeptide repeat-containing protein At3g48250, chloroplastic [Ipomoea trifida]